MICLPDDIADQSLILYRLVIAHIAIAGVILVMECGGRGQVSPATRLTGATTMTIFAVVSWSIFNSNPDSQVVGLVERIARDISVVAPLIVVDRLLRQIDDLSEQARRLGAWTLIALLVIGGTDVSGGLLYPYSRLWRTVRPRTSTRQSWPYFRLLVSSMGIF